MGFWHTGYIEFHEPVGLGEGYVPKPSVFACPHCTATFTTNEALRAHRFESHPYNRPILLINGMEIGNGTHRVTRHLQVNSIEAINASGAYINGVPISVVDLSCKLVETVNDIVVIDLYNERVSAQFHIRFAVASDSDLDGVDRCFLTVARRGHLDRRAIEDFISASREFPTAIEYSDGICEYFYGVMAKERAPQSTIPFEEYRIKFNRAVDKLHDFNRHISRSICALIAFHFNHFDEAMELCESSRVGIAAARFANWIKGDAQASQNLLNQTWESQLEQLLSDFETERLLSWSVVNSQSLLPQLTDITALIRRDIPEFDRVKLRVLLAETCVENGLKKEAKCQARELINSPIFDSWAEKLVKSLNLEE